MTSRSGHNPYLPTKEQVREFIDESDSPVGKREIAKAFQIKGADRIYLKQILKELIEEGVLEKGRKRELAPAGALPSIAVIEVDRLNEDGEPVAKPLNWSGEGAPPVIYVQTEPRSRGRGRGDMPAPGVGDRLLARLTRSRDGTYDAHIIRRLQAASGPVLGVYTRVGKDGRVQATDRKMKQELVVRAENSMGAESGEVVLCEILPSPGRVHALPEARVTQRIGPMGDAASVSLIAIYAHDIPFEFSKEAMDEAHGAKPVPLGDRTDLRQLPLVTIDPFDARDHDDAVWAAPDDDPANAGGWQIVVAIADVAHYVPYGSALDKAARIRGNSVYFPDRVVPMLPHELSGDLCSLHEKVDRPVLAVKMWLDANGNKLRHHFMRAMINSIASLTYHQVQAAHDGQPDEKTEPLMEAVIKPLYGAYEALKKARTKRHPLDLDIPERQVEIGEDGFIKAVHKRHRFAAHMLVEEFMIQANVSAAESLVRQKRPCMFRVHEPPAADKLLALHDTLEEMNIHYAKGQVMQTETFNRLLAQTTNEIDRELVSSLILRSQSQAVYSPENLHHFGLNLPQYAHFTSPIRRYADLLVHRSLISAFNFGDGGLPEEQAADFVNIGTDISNFERRAMVAERETTDRFTAIFLANKVGEIFQAKVSGVTRAGLFLTFDDTGADALVPMSRIGDDYFQFDPDRHTLTGRKSGDVYRLADRLVVRLLEVDIVTGSMIAEIVEGREGDSQPRRSGPVRHKKARGSKSGFGAAGKKKKRTLPKAKKRAKRRARES